MHFSERFLFIVYYTIYIEKPRYYKTFIQQENELDAKNTFIKKIKRDFKGITINNIRVVKLNRLKYRGSSLSDKQWESLKKYPTPILDTNYQIYLKMLGFLNKNSEIEIKTALLKKEIFLGIRI